MLVDVKKPSSTILRLLSLCIGLWVGAAFLSEIGLGSDLPQPSRLSGSLGVGFQATSVATLVDGAEKSFSISPPYGFATEFRVGGFSDPVAGFVEYAGQMPASFSRIETQIISLGVLYYLRKPTIQSSKLASNVGAFYSQRLFPFLYSSFHHETLFYVTADRDRQLVIIDRGAFGLGIGGGFEWAAPFINEAKGDWIPSDTRLRTLGLSAGATYSSLSSDENSTQLMSFSVRLKIRQPLD